MGVGTSVSQSDDWKFPRGIFTRIFWEISLEDGAREEDKVEYRKGKKFWKLDEAISRRNNLRHGIVLFRFTKQLFPIEKSF